MREQVASGRYAMASEVIRAAPREFELRAHELDTLLAHLDGGAAQAARGEFAEGFDVEEVIARAVAGAGEGRESADDADSTAPGERRPLPPHAPR